MDEYSKSWSGLVARIVIKKRRLCPVARWAIGRGCGGSQKNAKSLARNCATVTTVSVTVSAASCSVSAFSTSKIADALSPTEFRYRTSV
jgi:hypothetical protein